MTTKKYRLAVFIGRFQPFHRGHEYAVRRALELADHVLILIGSSGQPSTAKNPWTYEQRAKMIGRAFRGSDVNPTRFSISPLYDNPNDSLWIASVQEAVSFNDEDVVLVGHEKDASSWYVKAFPQWKYVDTGYEDIGGMKNKIDATKIREIIFEGTPMSYLTGVLHRHVVEQISDQLVSGDLDAVIEEYNAIKKEKAKWAGSPYTPIFVTVDACVIQSGHVLVVKRGKNPGKGLYALPGGFLDANERLVTAVLRELDEETSINLQPDVLRRCIHHVEVFDDPSRSLRGRLITHAFLFKLNDVVGLPKVRAGDDAAEALWLPLSDVNIGNFHEDHYHIITSLINKL